MFSLLNWLQDDLKLYEGFLENVFYYLWSYSIFKFVDFCYKGLQIFLVHCFRIAQIKKFRKVQIILIN